MPHKDSPSEDNKGEKISRHTLSHSRREIYLDKARKSLYASINKNNENDLLSAGFLY